MTDSGIALEKLSLSLLHESAQSNSYLYQRPGGAWNPFIQILRSTGTQLKLQPLLFTSHTNKIFCFLSEELSNLLSFHVATKFSHGEQSSAPLLVGGPTKACSSAPRDLMPYSGLHRHLCAYTLTQSHTLVHELTCAYIYKIK